MMSFAVKLFLCLILVLAVSLPVLTFAQDEGATVIELEQHEANVWQAKVAFWRAWEAQSQQSLTDHIAATWEAKVAFWKNYQPASE